MKYVGSKNRYAYDIIDAINSRCTFEVWIEPFVGGCNIIDKVKDVRRIALDNNEYLIAMWKALQCGWEPPSSITELQYKHVRDNKNNYDDALVGFVGIACSYSGKWFGGYARGSGRNYCDESKRNVLKQILLLQDVEFICSSYENIPVLDNSVIYCDPPYAQTTNSYHSDSYTSKSFWRWAVDKASTGANIFVSEYNAPHGWTSIWNKEVYNTLDQDTGSKKAVEKLFMYGQ